MKNFLRLSKRSTSPAASINLHRLAGHLPLLSILTWIPWKYAELSLPSIRQVGEGDILFEIDVFSRGPTPIKKISTFWIVGTLKPLHTYERL